MSGVIRLDNLAAVYGGAHIHSVKAKLNVENGHVGVVGTPYEGERELRLFKRPDSQITKQLEKFQN
jgi:hypothetical protein